MRPTVNVVDRNGLEPVGRLGRLVRRLGRRHRVRRAAARRLQRARLVRLVGRGVAAATADVCRLKAEMSDCYSNKNSN